MRTLRLGRLAALALVSLIAACSGMTVRSQALEGTDFDQIRTYAWLPRGNYAVIRPETIDWIRAAVDEELAAKGLTRVVEEDADVRIDEIASIAEKTQVNDPYFAFEQFETYEEGRLLIVFYEPQTRDVLWQGSAEARLKELKDVEDRRELVRDAVAAVMAKYPPR